MITMRSLASGPSAGAICGGTGKECECDPSSGQTSPMWGVLPCRDTPHAETPPAQAVVTIRTGFLLIWGVKPFTEGSPLCPQQWEGETEAQSPAPAPSFLLTLMEAPANRASCLMCCPFFPMMAPTA